MGYAILLVVGYLALNWARTSIGLDWTQFGLLAAAIPVAAAGVWLIRSGLADMRRKRQVEPEWTKESAQPEGPTAARRPKAAPEHQVIRRAVAAPLLLSYRDTAGASTERHVIPKTVVYTLVGGRPARGRVAAFCMSRQAMRSFRFDRIEQAAIAETGEIIDDVEAHLLGPERLH
jgi:predicted DNA-binding transcriptional regulator YafY